MNTRYAVWLNGRGLQDIDDSIIITDVQEQSPRLSASAFANARYPGQRLTRLTRQTLTVTVRFLIREYDVARRKRIADAVTAWAEGGGRLTTSDRMSQMLEVVCTDAPYAPSALKWTGEVSVGFTAYGTPYWQDEHPVARTVSLLASTPTAIELAPTGTAPYCFLTFDAENRGSGPVTTLTISTEASAFTLTDPALIPAGETLSLRYDAGGLLSIRAGDKTMLGARTGDSSDDLLLTPGRMNVVTFTADQPVQIRAKVRGLYL